MATAMARYDPNRFPRMPHALLTLLADIAPSPPRLADNLPQGPTLVIAAVLASAAAVLLVLRARRRK